jgi:hypothetical protein
MVERCSRGNEVGVALADAGLVVTTKDVRMPELAGRDLHLIKKALALAVLTVERSPESSFRSDNDAGDMKALLERMIESDTELAHYARAAHIAVTGKPALDEHE